MDEDLETMSRERLIVEARKLRNGIRLLDNALSYAHRAIDDLLRENGLPPHHPMDFASWYDAPEVPFQDDL